MQEQQHPTKPGHGEARFLHLRPSAEVAAFSTDSRLHEMEGEGMTNNDKRCAEAMARILRWLNLSCARHKYELRGKKKL